MFPQLQHQPLKEDGKEEYVDYVGELEAEDELFLDEPEEHMEAAQDPPLSLLGCLPE